MSLTTFLAIYAAILSSIWLGWNLYRELYDRACVKISISLMRIATGEPMESNLPSLLICPSKTTAEPYTWSSK